jgi:F-type H+-transporting ATPase subunit delta
MTHMKIARRYARALFFAASKLNQIQQAQQDLTTFCQMLDQSDTFCSYFLSPIVHPQEKIAFVKKFFDSDEHQLFISLMQVLLEKRRSSILKEICEEFEELRRQNEGVLYARIQSASELDLDEQKEAIKQIESATGKKLEAKFQIDPKLVAGVSIECDHSVFDGSVQNGLRRLREKMLRDVLKQANR